MNRRNFMSSILTFGMAPAIVRAESIMRVRPALKDGTIDWLPEAEDILNRLSQPEGRHIITVGNHPRTIWRGTELQCD